MCPVLNMAFSVVPSCRGCHLILARYFLNDPEMVPVTCIFTGITYDFAYHICSIPIESK